MQSANLVQLAKTGSAQAIAALIAHQLQPKGIRVRADLSANGLHLRFEAIQPLEAERLMPWLYRGLKSLAPKGIDRVTLSGWRHGATEPDWQKYFWLSAPLPPSGPELLAGKGGRVQVAAVKAARRAPLPEPPPPPSASAASLDTPVVLLPVASVVLAILLYGLGSLSVLATVVLLGLMVAAIAQFKRRRAWVWFCYGFLLFPVAIWHVAALDRFSWYGVVFFLLGWPLAAELVDVVGAEWLLGLAVLAFLPASLAQVRGRPFFVWYLYGLGALFVATLHAGLLSSRQLPQFAGQNCRDRHFAGQDLSGADFAGASLQGADLQDATLVGANFYQANLSGANLSRANLWGANFDTADLTAAIAIGTTARLQPWLQRPPRWLWMLIGAIAVQVLATSILAQPLLVIGSYHLLFVAVALFVLIVLGRNPTNKHLVTILLVLFGVLGILLTMGILLTRIRLAFFASPLLILGALALRLPAITGITLGTVFALTAYQQQRWPQLGLCLGLLNGLILIPFLTPISHLEPNSLFGNVSTNLTLSPLIVAAATGVLVGWWVGCAFDRSQLNLRRANLRQANFTDADLRHADFRQAITSSTNFTNADLRGAIAHPADPHVLEHRFSSPGNPVSSSAGKRDFLLPRAETRFLCRLTKIGDTRG
ncbi:MAG: pentapeptide repeat-containing protein [Spirulinaceae cyanobacterium SM2_1_0]|nr:pentapeptide repeat-containing protein [Spirulinaceae cyanobacterium SM2_1_0]